MALSLAHVTSETHISYKKRKTPICFEINANQRLKARFWLRCEFLTYLYNIFVCFPRGNTSEKNKNKALVDSAPKIVLSQVKNGMLFLTSAGGSRAQTWAAYSSSKTYKKRYSNKVISRKEPQRNTFSV